MARRLITYDEVLDVLRDLRFAVKEARRRDGISLRDLAQQSGVPFNSISRFERGVDVHLSAAMKLIEWLARPSTRDTIAERDRLTEVLEGGGTDG